MTKFFTKIPTWLGIILWFIGLGLFGNVWLVGFICYYLGEYNGRKAG